MVELCGEWYTADRNLTCKLFMFQRVFSSVKILAIYKNWILGRYTLVVAEQTALCVLEHAWVSV